MRAENLVRTASAEITAELCGLCYKGGGDLAQVFSIYWYSFTFLFTSVLIFTYILLTFTCILEEGEKGSKRHLNNLNGSLVD